MRISMILLMMLTIAATAVADDISHNPSVSLAGEKLFLASVESRPSGVLNEYIRKDETFDNWKVLFAVRSIRSAASIDEVVGRWKAYIAQVKSPGKSVREDVGSSPSDRRFTVAIRAPGDVYVEKDELRFVRGPEGKGVTYYEAAVRVDPKSQSDVRLGASKQAAFAQALKSVSVSPVERMPDPTVAPGN